MVCSAFRSVAETKSAGAFLATCSSASSPKSRLRPRAALRAASDMTFRRADWVLTLEKISDGFEGAEPSRRPPLRQGARGDAGFDLAVEGGDGGGRTLRMAPDASRDGQEVGARGGQAGGGL